ncbi:MAG: acetyl-CoA carboxylase biotin carboxyl carrier protein [Eubacteriales bacterium]|nr:acetyl-CoA carboxylase biotin carboxyl carrier protein [Eubacteriales bacterium]
MNVSDIRKLMETMAQTGLTEFEWSTDAEKIRLERKPALAPIMGETTADSAALIQALSHLGTLNAPATSPVSVPAAPVEEAPPAEPAGHLVTSPVVGIYYSAPSPDSDPFVRVGSSVEKGAPLCIIEAMKLMNEVTSPWSGVILEVLAENGQRVEYGQPLFRIGGV